MDGKGAFELEFVRLKLADRLVGIQQLCKDYGLPTVTSITLIARDPANDEMSIVLTNDADLQKATEVALRLAGHGRK